MCSENVRSTYVLVGLVCVPCAFPVSSFVRGLVLTRMTSLAECSRWEFAAMTRMQYNWSGVSPVMMTLVSFLSLSPMIEPLSWMRCFATDGLSGTAQRSEMVSAVTASRATRGTAGMSRLSRRMTWSTGRISSDDARYPSHSCERTLAYGPWGGRLRGRAA
jgi:hypothetical protein